MRRYIFLLLVMQVLFFTATAWPAPFTDNGNGTVTDNRTGLVWQQGEAGYMNWGSALSYCEGLPLGGKTDWRLPNIKELESLTDDTRYNPAIDTNYFPGAYASYYWSSTTYAFNPDAAWSVYFSYGYVYSSYKYNNNYVRCVRGGQSGSFGDLDNDGLPDAWEIQYFGNLAQNPGDDYDHDNLTNLKEYQLGTNPTKWDTDGDGVSDGDEVAQGKNPLDISDNTTAVIGGLLPDIPLYQQSGSGALVNDNYTQTKEAMTWNPLKFDETKPMVVIVHGWNQNQSDKFPEWVTSMGDFINQSGKANVIFWQWLEQAKGTTAIPPGQEIMLQQGNYLADILNDVLQTYNGKIHFIGHSAGASAAYTAVNRLVKEHKKSVDALTLLDAYMFDIEKCPESMLQTLILTQDITKLLGSCINSVLTITPASKADFLDNYWFGVGSLSNFLSIGFPSATMVDALIFDYFYDALKIFKDTVSPYPPSYFVDDGIADSFHKPPVNWYMASMVDQLQLAGGSQNRTNHKYGFYWSPIFNNARPGKGTSLNLLGAQNYFDLYTAKEYIKAVEVLVKQGVVAAIDFLDRVNKKAEEIFKSVYIQAIDDLKSTSGWITDEVGSVYHSAEGWIWAMTHSPVSFSKSYQIPTGSNIMGFSYEVLSGDNGDTIEVFIDEQLVFVRAAAEDIDKGIVFSDFINISQWSGKTVNVTFRINSTDGSPLIIKVHDIAFASFNKAEIVSVRISGGGYNFPQTTAYKATFSMDITKSSSPTGWLKYYYAKTRMNFVSTGITGVAVSGNTATISGTGKVNGVNGYTFEAIVADGLPDNFAITIRKPDGTVYYSAPSKAVSGSSLKITMM